MEYSNGAEWKPFGSGDATTEVMAAEAFSAMSLVGIAYNASNALNNLSPVRANADPGALTTPFVLGVALTETTIAGQVVKVLLSGQAIIPDALWDGGVPALTDTGRVVWASTATPGHYTLTPPTTTGHYRTKIGYLQRTSSGDNVIRVQIGDPIAL